MSTPASRARSIPSITSRALPARSPTVGLTCASAILTSSFSQLSRDERECVPENEAGPLFRGRCAHLRLRSFLPARDTHGPGPSALRGPAAALAEGRGGADPPRRLRRWYGRRPRLDPLLHNGWQTWPEVLNFTALFDPRIGPGSILGGIGGAYLGGYIARRAISKDSCACGAFAPAIALGNAVGGVGIFLAGVDGLGQPTDLPCG